MINEVFGFKPLKEIKVPQSESFSSTQNSGQLVSKLQIGDVIEGILVQEENNIVLRLDNGVKLSVNLLDHVELGKVLSFVVAGKEGQKLVLKPNLSEILSNKQFIDKVMSELKLPNQLEMKSIIGQFVAKQLPLDKESLLTIFQGYKTYDLPTEILVNLKSSETPIESKDIQRLASLKSEGINLILEEFKSIVEGIKNSSQLEKLVHDLGNTLSMENLQKVIKGTLLNSEIMKQVERQNVEEYGVLVEASSIEEALKEWFLSSSPKDQLESKINGYLGEQLGHSYVKILKTLAQTIFKTTLEVDITQIKQDIKESEKIISTSTHLEEIIKHLDKLDLSDEGREKLQQMNQTFQVVQKYNVEAQYFYFPLILNEQQGAGELYFFKPKKKQGSMNERMYIVMALNMPSLRKVEVHIEQIQNAVNMTLKVEMQSMKKQIEDSLDELSEEISRSGYELNQLHVALLRDTKIQEEIDTGLYHMDLKA